MAPPPSRAAIRAAGLIALAGLACATADRRAYSPEELRAELLLRVPELRPEEAVVPFEVSAEYAERARAKLRGARNGEIGVQLLIDSLPDPDGFGLRYEWATTTTAMQTLERGGGNCFALSSVLVGLVRASGLRAYYAEVILDEPRWRTDGDLSVYADHIAALVVTGNRRLTVDYSGQLGQAQGYRVIDDLEALAHFYNNRGYERIHTSRQDETPVPWADVRQDFTVATRIQPNLARAWNNLGVASTRIGDLEAAENAYLRAVEIEDLQSAHLNLSLLNLRRGNVDQAIVHLRAVRRLDPRNPQLGELFRAAAEALVALEEPSGG